MGTKLVIDTQIVDDTLYVQFTGQIDEDAEFSKLSNITLKKVIFDFEKITLLNSCGIREWISFLESIPQNTQITYRHCQQIIIEQINMVHGFIREGAKIESFYAPYYCGKCDLEHKVLLTPEKIKDHQAPTVSCPKCQEEMEFDAIETQYFNFLK